MELIFMGTGTSQGVPMIAQPLENGCDLSNPLNWRGRTSVHLKAAGLNIQVDAAPEFRLQCLANKIEAVDHFFLTHGHADHVLGMDDLRRFIDLRGGEALPVYSSLEGLERVRAIFPYAIRPKPEFKGYPAFTLLEMPAVLNLPGLKISSTTLPHGRLQVLGLVFEELESGKKLVYYTDCKMLTKEALALGEEADVVVLDALRPMPHPTHMSVREAIEAAHALKAKRTYFTHLTYLIDAVRDGGLLPPGMAFAHDGLRVLI
jgi:phosphoribosyl 1,2-cyclic phosphate phosphodiesterase